MGVKKRVTETAASQLKDNAFHLENGQERSKGVYAPGLLVPVFSGVTGGVMSCIVCSPFDVAKVRMQVQGLYAAQYRGTFNVLSQILAEEGFRGLFKGITPALVTIPLFWGIYFPVYEKMKKFLGDDRVTEQFPPFLRNMVSGRDNPLVHMSSAIGAGFVSDVVTNPFWVVRTRLQTQIFLPKEKRYKGMLDAFYTILTQEGIQALYKGLKASLLGLAHVAIQFPIYERLKFTSRANHGGQETLSDLILASVVSKFCGSVVTYPHEVIRSRLQDSRGKNVSIVRVVRHVIRSEGTVGLYRGFQFNLLRVLPSSCATLIAYEGVSRLLHPFSRSS